MSLIYQSTRNSSNKVTASQAILQGLATDGGLYVPVSIPDFDLDFKKLSKLPYQEVAFLIMSKFFPDFTDTELKECIYSAYDEKFEDPKIAPVKKVGEDYLLELFHGSTIAFKDMALSILPYLMTTAAKKNNVEQEIVILTATSGDTGKAAMAGFSDVPGTKIIVFYPKNGVSPIQEQQMVTQKGENTTVIGITGNFDDAQTNVKDIFNNLDLKVKMAKNGYQFSSANSINIGRLVPQIVYYVYAYAQLVGQGEIECGEKINFSVPTGNFGNILAGYYAKQIGVPINQFICASNENNVLTDFFQTGVYDRKRPFFVTSSPSMDILISSNLERLIFHLTGNSATYTKSLMTDLATTGEYQITPEMQENLSDFYGGFATESEIEAQIKTTFEADEYVLDPHTAVALAVNNQYKKKHNDLHPTVMVSTASPYKFPRVVVEAISTVNPVTDDFQLFGQLEEKSGVQIPQVVATISQEPVLHDTVIESDQMQKTIEKLLNLV